MVRCLARPPFSAGVFGSSPYLGVVSKFPPTVHGELVTLNWPGVCEYILYVCVYMDYSMD